MVGRSTVCDDNASRLLFVSPVPPTWYYVLCGVRLPAVVLLQSLQIVTGALVWHGVDVSGTVMYDGACKVVRLLIEVLAVCVLQIVRTLYFYAVESCGIDVWTVADDVACYSCVGSHVSGSSIWSGKELWLCAKVLAGACLGPCTASCMVLVSVLPCRVALTLGQWLYSGCTVLRCLCAEVMLLVGMCPSTSKLKPTLEALGDLYSLCVCCSACLNWIIRVCHSMPVVSLIAVVACTQTTIGRTFLIWLKRGPIARRSCVRVGTHCSKSR